MREERERVVEAEANEKQKTKTCRDERRNAKWGERDERQKIGKTIDRINVF